MTVEGNRARTLVLAGEKHLFERQWELGSGEAQADSTT